MKIEKFIFIRVASVICLLICGCLSALAQTAVTVTTEYADINGRKIAYRSIGQGTPIQPAQKPRHSAATGLQNELRI
jgi:hypothetical protein